jgi:uncharacterized membrane protein YhiD involved in acid resistance
VRLIKDDFLRFILLTNIALISGSIAIGLVFGCFYGVIVIALIIVFLFSTLRMGLKSITKTKKRRHRKVNY